MLLQKMFSYALFPEWGLELFEQKLYEGGLKNVHQLKRWLFKPIESKQCNTNEGSVWTARETVEK